MPTARNIQIFVLTMWRREREQFVGAFWTNDSKFWSRSEPEVRSSGVDVFSEMLLFTFLMFARLYVRTFGRVYDTKIAFFNQAEIIFSGTHDCAPETINNKYYANVQ